MEDIPEYHRTFLSAVIYRPSLLNMSAFWVQAQNVSPFPFSLSSSFSNTSQNHMSVCPDMGHFLFPDTFHRPTAHHRACLPFWPPTQEHNFLPFSIYHSPSRSCQDLHLDNPVVFLSSSEKIILHFLSETCLNSFIRKIKTHNRGSVFPSNSDNSYNPTIILRYCVVWATIARRGKHSCPCWAMVICRWKSMPPLGNSEKGGNAFYPWQNEGGRADTGTCPGSDGHDNRRKKMLEAKVGQRLTLGMMKRECRKQRQMTMQMVPEAPEAPSQGEINLSLNKGVEIFTIICHILQYRMGRGIIWRLTKWVIRMKIQSTLALENSLESQELSCRCFVLFWVKCDTCWLFMGKI